MTRIDREIVAAREEVDRLIVEVTATNVEIARLLARYVELNRKEAADERPATH